MELKNNKIRYWLKNQNAIETKIWRYQHYDSYSQVSQKKALLKACLGKIQNMSSDKKALRISARDKIKEFMKLGYPTQILRQTCNYLGASTGEGTWITIRDDIDCH